MIYLASPYSHPSESMRQSRYEEAVKALSWLWQNRITAFSPIVYTHKIAIELQLPFMAIDWLDFNDRIMSVCDEMYVLQLSGWKESLGIKGELIKWPADKPKKLMKPVGDNYIVSWP